MSRSLFVVAAFTVAVVVAFPGCRRGPAADTVSLAGRVVIDGAAVKKGGIQFMPIERGQPAFSEVRDGVYSARVPKGRLRVIFSSVNETGREIEVYSTKVPEVLDALPPSLREGIEITVERDDAARDFVLQSQPERGK